MNILITGAGFENKGAEAMMLTVQQELSLRIQDITFFVAVLDIERRMALELGFLPVVPECIPPRLRLFLTTLVRRSRHFPDKICQATNQLIFLMLSAICHFKKHPNCYNALIDVSGYSFSDGGISRMLNMTSCILSSSRMLANNVFLPQAWGPFTNTRSKFWVNKLQSQSTLLFSRDSISSKYLLNSNIPSESIIQAPDIALLFRGSRLSVGKAILNSIGLKDSTRPTIAIVPNMRVYERSQGNGTGNQYIILLQSFTRLCIDEFNANIVFLSNECLLANNTSQDDRYLCSLLYSSFKDREHIFSLTSNYHANEIKSVIGNMDFVIASRFHSLVFALSQTVPVLALGWSHKYLELLKIFSQEEYVIPHDDLEISDSLDLLRTAWLDRSNMSNQIRTSLPAVKQRLNQLFDNIASTLQH